MTGLCSEGGRFPVNHSDAPRHGAGAALRSDGTAPWTPVAEDGPVSDRAVPILRLLSYVKSPEDYVLSAGTNKVGRHPENDVVIESRFVSRWHCAIQVDQNGRCSVRDVGSAAGVVVNGERIAGPKPLRYGDELCVGNQRFVLLLVVNGMALTELHE